MLYTSEPFIPQQKVDKTKYKTEMCKNWIEVGHCRYGVKCQFAHGDHELHGKAPPANNNKYKSKTCTTFADRLYCPYGQRCLFKHEDRSLEELRNYHYVYKLLLLDSIAHRRLPIFEVLTEDRVQVSPVSKINVQSATAKKDFSSPSLSFKNATTIQSQKTGVSSEIGENHMLYFSDEEDTNFTLFINEISGTGSMGEMKEFMKFDFFRSKSSSVP